VPRALFAIVRPLHAFFRQQAASGILLLLATVLALVWVNSPLGDWHHHLFGASFRLEVGPFRTSTSIHHVINDALMVVFFLVAGMEIKRAMVVGDLDSPRKAALPLLAAAGGMLVPALVYAALNRGTEGSIGWGIPVATDIAFALACLTVLGSRVPRTLFVFLTALAIFDDLGAILVIALFYGGSLDVYALLAAGLFTALLVLLGWLRVQRVWPYVVVGLALWVAFLYSGIHATVAGVILGLTLPVRALRSPADILTDVDEAIDALRAAVGRGEKDDGAITSLERHLESVQPPLDRVEHAIGGLVAFGIVPLFALANAGVSLEGDLGAMLGSPVTLGAAIGLVVGKPIGVLAATWLAVTLRLAPKPEGATWMHVFGVACLAGIGFTMSLFVAALAFGDGVHMAEAKLGILVGSVISATAGLLVLRLSTRP
jgi:Na+:H+ antiporter, NhaA family